MRTAKVQYMILHVYRSRFMMGSEELDLRQFFPIWTQTLRSTRFHIHPQGSHMAAAGSFQPSAHLRTLGKAFGTFNVK